MCLFELTRLLATATSKTHKDTSREHSVGVDPQRMRDRGRLGKSSAEVEFHINTLRATAPPIRRHSKLQPHSSDPQGSKLISKNNGAG